MYKRIINRLLKRYQIKNVSTQGKYVYLTFDDGPEEGITEFVIDELDKYRFKATFFCRGDNAEKNPILMSMLREKGHSIGNHTFGHLHAYNVSSQNYLADVEKADRILHTNIFRPPHACLTLQTWLHLRNKYSIVYWSVNSGDSDMSHYNYNKSIERLKSTTHKGDIVLFHFCHKHEMETRQLFPEYLQWLAEQGFTSKGL